MLVQRHRALAPPASLVLFQLDLIVFLGVAAGRLAANLYGGIGRRFAEAYLAHRRTALVPHLQKRIHLIALHLHIIVIIGRIVVDLRPAVVGSLGLVPPGDGQIHCDHAAVVVDRIQRVVVPQMQPIGGLRFYGFCRGAVGLRVCRFCYRKQRASGTTACQCGPQQQDRPARKNRLLHHDPSFLRSVCFGVSCSNRCSSRVNQPVFSVFAMG